MTRKIRIAGFAAAAVLAGASGIPAAGAVGNCDPGDRIDGSTAVQAKTKMEAAGYTQIRGLRKGCDNYWHSEAMKNGTATHIVLSPAGEVMAEGD